MAAVLARKRAALLPSAEPNVIPFIDVLLVLLIIFMVTAPKPTTDLRVDMPRPGPARLVALPPTIVAIRQTGGVVQVFIDNEEVASDELPQRALAHLLAANPSLTAEDALANAHIYVRADLDVAYQRVISVVDALEQAQVDHVAISAQQA
jgi:biopolymer transport protein ExbD